MTVEFRTPHPALADYVGQLWHCEDYVLEHAWERIMPSAGSKLLINLADDELRWRGVGGRVQRIKGFGVCGPQLGPFEIDTAQQRFIMGVEFHPRGLAAMLRVAAHETTSAHVAVSDLVGRQVDGLHGRLIDARTASRRFEIIESWLLERLSRAPSRPQPVGRALELIERMSVAQVAERMGLSPKKLIQAFRLEVGLSPKRFCRVRRFERLLESIEKEHSVNWAVLAYGHGYYDQAHLAHEFRSLAGLSPSEYLRMRGPSARHVRIGD